MNATLGLIAGNGRLPFEVADAACERGLRLAIVALVDNTDPAIEMRANGPLVWVRFGELGRMIAFLQESGADEVILAGGVSKNRILTDVPATASGVRR